MKNKSSGLFLILGLLVLLIIGLVVFNLFLSGKITINFLKPKPGSCLILEEKYCKKVKLVSDPWTNKGLIAVFKLPEGTTIFAPAEGSFSDTPSFSFPTTKKIYSGSTVLVSKDGTYTTAEYAYNMIYFKGKSFFEGRKVKKGEKLANVSERNIEFFGNYNFVFSVEKYIHSNIKIESEIDTKLLKEILNIR